MKKRNLLFTLLIFISVICGMGFLAVNIYENARVKPSDISHEGGGGSRIQNFYYSFDTPDFKAMGEKIATFAGNAGEVISTTATELGGQVEEDAKEFVSEHCDGEEIPTEQIEEEE